MTSTIELTRIANLTTGTDLVSMRKGAFLEASGFGAASLNCVFPAATVQAAHLVSVSGRLSIAGESSSFEAAGKILTVEAIGDGNIRVEIALRQFDKDLWERFLGAKRIEQGRVDLLFAKIKG